MSKHIDADEIHDLILEKAVLVGDQFVVSFDQVKKSIDECEEFPTKSEWAISDYRYDGENEYPILECINCGYVALEDMDEFNFCPRCGRDMRGTT